MPLIAGVCLDEFGRWSHSDPASYVVDSMIIHAIKDKDIQHQSWFYRARKGSRVWSTGSNHRWSLGWISPGVHAGNIKVRVLSRTLAVQARAVIGIDRVVFCIAV